ncbi:hypothetical protein BH09BAC2_BH09BAC2_04300 [soil metagenome]
MPLLSRSIILCLFTFLFCRCSQNDGHPQPAGAESLWHGPNKYQIKPENKLVAYGHDLIENTAYYLGPAGRVAQISNGMNCQNCHLEGGTLPWGNNYGAVASTYPKFRERSGSIESIPKRINDCFERSLNGKPLNDSSYEMKAIVAYMQWLGMDVKKGKKPNGSGIMDLPLLERAANPEKGKIIYANKCVECHGATGQGLINPEQYGYVYPPLWGEHSFNTGAGLNRLSRMAGYVKNNMPFQKAGWNNPLLTNEEAWDVAAYILSQPRPVKDVSKDYPNINKKPFDYSYPPFADSFSLTQHKFGPFQPVKAFITFVAGQNK